MFHTVDFASPSRFPTAAEGRRDKHYALFVADPNDLVGLVAFALHERQAREWRDEMQRACNRAPTDAEIRAWRIGEVTPRRILAYRFLAAESMAGRGSEAPARPALNPDPTFALFCSSEYDFVGVVAFAIHEQQVREWREAMLNACGRQPSDEEMRAHRISETSPRRILAYRFLAAERLAGRGPDLTPGVAKVSFIARALGAGAREAGGKSRRWRAWSLYRA